MMGDAKASANPAPDAQESVTIRRQGRLQTAKKTPGRGGIRVRPGARKRIPGPAKDLGPRAECGA